MTNHDFYIVGIGASAGGLDPLKELVAHLPKTHNACFVIVQHLHPDFRSQLDKILGRQTEIPVIRIECSQRVEPGVIYVIAENKVTTFKQGRLVLRERRTDEKINYAIDIFFESLAREMKDKAIGIVLSGANDDGSDGAKYISDYGGIVMTQDPTTATHPKMPLEVIRQDDPKLIAPVGQIAYSIRSILTRESYQQTNSHDTDSRRRII
jgi:chemotaxis response regulator CheB